MRPWRMGTRSGSRLVRLFGDDVDRAPPPRWRVPGGVDRTGDRQAGRLPLAGRLLGAHVVHPVLERAVDPGARLYPLAPGHRLVVRRPIGPLLFPYHCGGSHCRCSFCGFLSRRRRSPTILISETHEAGAPRDISKKYNHCLELAPGAADRSHRGDISTASCAGWCHLRADFSSQPPRTPTPRSQHNGRQFLVLWH